MISLVLRRSLRTTAHHSHLTRIRSLPAVQHSVQSSELNGLNNISSRRQNSSASPINGFEGIKEESAEMEEESVQKDASPCTSPTIEPAPTAWRRRLKQVAAAPPKAVKCEYAPDAVAPDQTESSPETELQRTNMSDSEVEEEFALIEESVQLDGSLEIEASPAPTTKRERLKQAISSSLPEPITSDDARAFFDAVAPHANFTLLRKTAAHLKANDKSIGSVPGSIEDKVNRIWDYSRINSKNRYTPPAQIPPEWLQTKLRNLLIGKPWDTPVDENAEDYAPIANRMGWEVNVMQVMAARENSLKFPLRWTADNTYKVTSTDAEETVLHRQSLHNVKSLQEQRDDAEALLNFLADTLPIDQFDLYMARMEYIGKMTRRRRFLDLLLKGESCKAPQEAHLHRIVAELCDFFYVEQNDSVATNMEFRCSVEKWDKARDAFVAAIPFFHHYLLEKLKKQKLQELEEDVNTGLILKPTASDKKKPAPVYHISLDAMVENEEEKPVVENSDRMVFIDNLPIEITEEELIDLYSRCGPVESVSIFNLRPELDPGPLRGRKLTERKRRSQLRRRRQNSTVSHKWARARTPVYARMTFETDAGYRIATGPSLRLFGMVERKHDMRTIAATSMSKLYIDLPKGLHANDWEHILAESCAAQSTYVCLAYGQYIRTSASPTSCEISFPSFEVAHANFEAISATVQSINAQENVTVTDDDNDDEIEVVGVHWLQTPAEADLYWTRHAGAELR